MGRPGSQRGGVASGRRPICSVHVMCSEGSRLSGARAHLVMMNCVGSQAPRRPRGSLSVCTGQGLEWLNNGEGEVGMRGGRLPAPKARKPARYLTTPLSQIRLGHMVEGVPRALQGPLLQPAAATCFEHHRSNTTGPSAAGTKSAVCTAWRFRLTSAELMGGARAHPECQRQKMVSTPDHDGRPRAPPAPACCICLHDSAQPPPPANWLLQPLFDVVWLAVRGPIAPLACGRSHYNP